MSTLLWEPFVQILTLDSLTATANGIRVEGKYDLAGEVLIALRVGFRVSQQNAGLVKTTERGPAGVVRITTPAAHSLWTGNRLTVSRVLGTVEANGDWFINVISNQIFDLRRTVFTTPHAPNTGEWFVNDQDEITQRVDGDPPPTPWAHEIVLQRPAIYDVRAILSWTGSPSVIYTAYQSIQFPYP